MVDYVLAGDIGGTKTSLGLFVRGKTKRPLLRYGVTYHSGAAATLEELLERFITGYHVPIAAVCLGVAGAVDRRQVKAANLPWKVSEAALARRFGWPRVQLINDLVATAYAVPLLRKNEVFQLQRGRGAAGANVGLMAPGTGLGTALLVACNGQYMPVPSEGGHVGFAPLAEDDLALWHYLAGRFGHVSLERVLSGPGLYTIYCWLRDSGCYQEPAWLVEQLTRDNAPRLIAERAMAEGDPLCLAALEKFVALLGSAAGDLALIGMTIGGLFLGGGIPPKILTKLQQPCFLAAFNHKGRLSEIMPRFPVSVILNEQAALLGAAYCALNVPAAT